jgi:hypothetical protein
MGPTSDAYLSTRTKGLSICDLKNLALYAVSKFN